MKVSVPWIRKALLCLAIPALLGGLPRVAPATDLERLFEPYQRLLAHHVVERELPGGGLVSAFDYRAALAAGESPELLADQRRRLAGFDIASLETRERSLAFWINAYNFIDYDWSLNSPENFESTLREAGLSGFD